MTDRFRAGLWMLGAVASFTLMAVAGREAGRTHDTFEIMLYRSLTGLGLIVVFMLIARRWREVGFGHLPLMTLRNLVHFGGQNLWLYALMVLPLAQVFALEFTTPIWVLLLAPVILGEPITRRGAVATALGFVGILVVARPGATLDPALIAALGAALCFAVTNLTTRRLTRSVTVLSILFWLHLMQAGFALIVTGWDSVITPPWGQSALPLFAVGILGLSAHLCLTTALSLAPAQAVAPIDFLRLPLIVLVGVALYAEPLDAAILLGGAIILLANWINLGTAKARP